MTYMPGRGSGESCLSLIVEEALVFTVVMVAFIALLSVGAVAVINAAMWAVGL